jgi:hypothetical protein
MAQQDTPAKAALSQHGKQAHFLTTTHRLGNTDPSPEMGLRGVEHSVFVFDGENGIDNDPVVLGLTKGGFGVQEYLSADEARTLAAALNMAADHADKAQTNALDQFIDKALAAAGVAA